MVDLPQKPSLEEPLAGAYSPGDVETFWDKWWNEKNLFTPEKISDDSKEIIENIAKKCEENQENNDEKYEKNDEKNEEKCEKNDEKCTNLSSKWNAQQFSIVIPPPNVTGSLHLGHTLTVAIEDALTRWHRMLGHTTVWIPGTDHAGIATQAVVERMLMKEGKTRHDLGREKFLEKVWEWKTNYGGRIESQLKRIGASVDWSRNYFSMDRNVSKAVVEAFVRMHRNGIIYRKTRLVSYSCFLKTALSDIEVDQDEITAPTKIKVPGFDFPVECGYLWHFFYPVEGLDQKIEIATTRIETMLGDTAVAVHPDDTRYKDIIGKKLTHPFFPDRNMYVIADTYVDMEFGTGAVKITPAHDKNDYEIGLRHDLPFITIFTLDGKISSEGGEFSHQHRFECRHKIQIALKEKGLLGEKLPNTKPMQLPRCSRSGDIIEYMLVPQWYVDCTSMAERAIKVVKTGELEILPTFHHHTWYYWLWNIKDWCISRQLWWGHRIPAYRVHPINNNTENNITENINTEKENRAKENTENNVENEVWVVGYNIEEAREEAEKIGYEKDTYILEQDMDVLDTWFSAGLFAIATLGWPDLTRDMNRFFPTTLLETGHDILFFWVARMVMMTLYLTDCLPFKTVYLHAMVRDAQGHKMSKSKGNVIDPIEAIEGISLNGLCDKIRNANLSAKEEKYALEAQKKDFPQGIGECGADALRYGLLAYTRQGRSVNLDINRVIGYRHFCNKIWNATKFALSRFPECWNSSGIIMAIQKSTDMKGNMQKYNVQKNDNMGKNNNIEKNNMEQNNYLEQNYDMVKNNMEKNTMDCLNFGSSYCQLRWTDKWILHRLSLCAFTCNKKFEEYEFADVVTSTYNFWLYDFCDVYLEMFKLYTPSDDSIADRASYDTLYTCLDWGLRLLHPLMPFITEELYQHLTKNRIPNCIEKDTKKYISISIAPYPLGSHAWIDYVLDDEVKFILDIIKHFRSLQNTLEIAPKIKPDGFIRVKTDCLGKLLEPKLREIAARANMGKLELTDVEAPGCIMDIISDKVEIFISASNLADLGSVIKKIEKKKTVAENRVKALKKTKAAPDYLTKVPEAIRNLNDEKDKALVLEIEALDNAFQKLTILKV